MPKTFKGVPKAPKQARPVEKEISFDVGKLIRNSIVGVVIVASITIVSVTAWQGYQRWNTAWAEVQFTVDHPQLVKQLREKYESEVSSVGEKLFVPEDRAATISATTETNSFPKVQGGK